MAALLNAAHPAVDYPVTTAQVIDMVKAAAASGNKATVASLEDTLEEFNELGADGLCS